jgi:hypothetical protein
MMDPSISEAKVGGSEFEVSLGCIDKETGLEKMEHLAKCQTSAEVGQDEW